MRKLSLNSKKWLTVLLVIFSTALFESRSYGVDQYPGDTSIYGVSTATVPPNVLIILDNSGSMNDSVVSGIPYDPATTYPPINDCQGGLCQSNKVYKWQSSNSTWINWINDISGVSCSSAHTSLQTTGLYTGKLKTTGVCTTTNGSFALGNYVNWKVVYGTPRPKIDVAHETLTNLISSTNGVNFGLMIFNTDEGGHIAGVPGSNYGYTDNYGYNGYRAYVKDMDAIFSGTTTNRTALVNTINNIPAQTWTPLAETLFEAMRYYKGAATAFSTQNGNITYTTPIEYSCQKNYVIIITDGMSTQDQNAVLKTICNNGDCDGDGYDNPPSDPAVAPYDSNGSDYLDDVAKYLYDNDLLPDGVDPKTTGKQNVITHTVGFGLGGVTNAENFLKKTAYNGGGTYYAASSTGTLSESLRKILASIIEDNTSFVAPVVPVSPENRTFSGNRIYMGYFRPNTLPFWSGNLKKYGLDSKGSIVDQNGNPATNADGSIRDNAVSYWSSAADGGSVEKGGAGSMLMTRSTARNIYTYTGTNLSLTDASNAFTASNAAVTAATLNVIDNPSKNSLINYVYGQDAYDENNNGNTTELRNWIMGDILHSKPIVVHYNVYDVSQESDCSINKTVIFVGANDGMIHAFKDCDGSELWAFVPPDILPNLCYTTGTCLSAPPASHTYYVDSSASVYTYNKLNDGNINAATDKVVLIFGERRGGGSYYAIDITTQASPKFMWQISSTLSPSGNNTDYSELAESWSEPSIAKIITKVSGTDTTKVVAFIGGGYDNVSEDQAPPVADTKGRGVYAVEIATLSSLGVPSFSTSGYKVWGYTRSDNSSFSNSVPSQIAVIDVNADGAADRIYAPDVNGNMWRFDTGSDLTSDWTTSARIIFKSNPGADASAGRKMFYKPAVTLEIGYEGLFFGTGDREHPAGTTIVDRLYAVKDQGQTTAKTESDLLNATSTLVDISGSTVYGWYIKLNVNSGEKDLSTATVINKVAYFTTYTPPTTGSICMATDTGTARFYATNYLTAEAAYNYDLTNDSGGVVLGTTDRSMTIGAGIPSGMVTVISPNGISAIVATGGALIIPPINATGGSIPTYWREVH